MIKKLKINDIIRTKKEYVHRNFNKIAENTEFIVLGMLNGYKTLVVRNRDNQQEYFIPQTELSNYLVPRLERVKNIKDIIH